MLKRPSIILLFLFNLLLASVSCSEGSPNIKDKDQLSKVISNLETDSILILSIPAGKQIYLAPDEDKKVEREGGVIVEESHTVLNENNLKGTTPLVLKNMKPGKYLLGISPVLVIDRSFGMGEFDPTLELEGIVSFDGNPLPMNRKDYEGAYVYSIQKEASKPLNTVVIAYHKKTGRDLEELKNIYPDDEVFEFNETDFVSDFKGKAFSLVTETQINDITALLKRGGKTVFYLGDFTIHAEIETKDTWKIDIIVRMPKK